MKKWKDIIIKSNLKENKLANAINIISLGLGAIIFALFSGFYLSEQAVIDGESDQFVEYLAANIEKSEVVKSESSFLKLKQVRRPSQNEVISLLDKGINAKIALNLNALFTSEYFMVYEAPVPTFTPIFLESFDFDETQKTLLIEVNNAIYEEYHSIYVNQNMYKKLCELYAFNFENAVINYQCELEKNVNEKITITINFKVAGILRELEYLTTPKVYFDQSVIEELLRETYFESGENIMDFLFNLGPDHPLTSYSFRLYFASKSDVERTQRILKKLDEGETSLHVTEEHLSRMESLEELFKLVNIVMIISAILILMSFVFINVTVTHLELKKNNAKNALLFFYGARTSDFIDLYMSQNMGLIMCSLIGLFFIPKVEQVLNKLIYQYLGINNMIKTPLLIYKGIPFLLPLIIFLLLFISATLIAIINILLKNQKTLIKRLAQND